MLGLGDEFGPDIVGACECYYGKSAVREYRMNICDTPVGNWSRYSVSRVLTEEGPVSEPQTDTSLDWLPPWYFRDLLLRNSRPGGEFPHA